MICNLDARKEYMAIRSLFRYKRHRKVLADGIEFGSHWIDICDAAMLLCRTAFWGNAQSEIDAGPTQEYPGADLKSAVKLINPTTGEGGCRFVVGGPPDYLLQLLRYYRSGMLVAVDPKERHHYLGELAGTVMQAQEKASSLKCEVKV